MDPPISKCVFCLDLVGEEDVNHIDSTLISSLTGLCFQKHPDLEYLHTTFLDSMEQAPYCTLCFSRVSEIHDFQEQLIRIRKRLTHLTNALDTYVIEKYKTLKDQDVPDDEPLQVLELRVQLYKLFKPFGNLENSKTDFEFLEKNEVSPARSTSNSILMEGFLDPSLKVAISPTPTCSQMTRAERGISAVGLTRRRTRAAKSRSIEEPFLCIPRISIADVIIKSEPTEEGTNATVLSDFEGHHAVQKKMSNSRRTRRNTKAHSSSRKKALRCTYSGCNKIFPTESRRFGHIQREHDEDGASKAPKQSSERCVASASHLEVNRKTPKANPKKKGISFPCTVAECTKEFTLESMLFGHVKRVHEGLTTFKCAHCDKVCSKPSKLRIHERQHTGELPFECTICQKRFSARQYLQQHSSIHNDKFACKICGKPCATLVSLQYHLNTHSAAKPFICELCGYTCTSKQYLDIHQANQHQGATELEAIKCHVCGKCLSSKSSLQSHLISIHKIGEAKFQCSHCSSAFTNKRELRKHMNNVHLNLKQFECMICNKKFSTQANVRMHHERQHVAKEERPRPFECPTCLKRFFLKKTLENHLAIHSTERPFPCEQCNRRFPSKSYLDLHIYTIHDKRKKKSDPNFQPGENQRREGW